MEVAAKNWIKGGILLSKQNYNIDSSKTLLRDLFSTNHPAMMVIFVFTDSGFWLLLCFGVVDIMGQIERLYIFYKNIIYKI